jgi:hypothetical protein
MDAACRTLIEALHQAPGKCVLALTGGGTSAAALLLMVPGGSRTVLEVLVPYAEQALCEFLGRRPEQFCSTATSHDMALRALQRARWLAPGESVVGLGCTASLATDRPKRGDHRFHVSVATGQQTIDHSLTLSKGVRDREGEEAVLATVILNALAEALHILDRLPLPLLAGEELQIESEPSRDALSAFLRGDVPTVCVDVDGRPRLDAPRPAVLLPGAFNPLHEGHRGLAQVAAQLVSGSVAYELSVTNVDKPSLTAEEVRRRLAQFAWHDPLWLTRAPTFVEKAAIFPGAVFGIGADTAARIVASRYYQDSAERMTAALDAIRRQGCRFLVAGRVIRGGCFLEVEQIAVPSEYRNLFCAIPATQFRLDISSTLLREKGPNAKELME